jgi:hypothetical protein
VQRKVVAGKWFVHFPGRFPLEVGKCRKCLEIARGQLLNNQIVNERVAAHGRLDM